MVRHGRVLSPAFDLEKNSKCVEVCIPVECPRRTGLSTSVAVRGHKSAGEGGATGGDDRMKECGRFERRVTQHKRRESEVIARLGDEGGRPVEQGPVVVFDEQIERVEIAVADGGSTRARWVLGEPAGGGREVGAARFHRPFGERGQEVIDVRGRGHVAGPKRGSYRLGIESVKACGDMAEEFRETPDQGGKVTKGAEPVEASHWRMPWCAVHEEEGRVETRVALTGEAHCGHGQAWRAISRWKTVSLAASASSGMTRSTRVSADGGTCARCKTFREAQKPPLSGSGGPSSSACSKPGWARRSCRSRSSLAGSSSIVTVFTVTVISGTVAWWR